MKSRGFFILVFIAFLISIDVFSYSCQAGKLCPVRAVPVNAPEGVKCVCGHDYFGKNCRFKGQNVLALTATWVSVNNAQVTWNAGPKLEIFHIFTRRVQYDNGNGVPTITYSKWRAGVEDFNFKDSAHQVGLASKDESHKDVTPTGVVYTPSPRSISTVLLHLNSAFSYEIQLVTNGNKNKSSTIFLDGPFIQAIALHGNTKSSNSSEEDKCPSWYSCPERWFIFITVGLNKPCFKKGIIIGVVLGVIGTVLLSAIIYGAIRFCIHCVSMKKREKIGKLYTSSNNTTSGEEPCKPCDKDTVKTSRDSVVIDMATVKTSRDSIVIDMENTGSLESTSNADTQPESEDTRPESEDTQPESEKYELPNAVQDSGSVSIVIATKGQDEDVNA